MSSPPSAPPGLSGSGMALAVGAYSIWGLTPIYWKTLAGIPAAEILVPRVVWTVLLLLLATRLVGGRAEKGALSAPGWGSTVAAALLLATNWGLFIFAVQSDQVLATSLGYYINPLASVLLGVLVLGERLNVVQGAAVALAGVGVLGMTLRAGELPWISLALAGSFAIYGLIHKLSPRPPLAGLTREMLVLTPLALAALASWAATGDSALIHAPLGTQLQLTLAGLVTAAPLLLFHAATRRLPLIAVGMFQYIAPTLTLLLAVVVYDEAFTRAHALAFGCIWTALALFSFDSFRRARVVAPVLVPTRNFPRGLPPEQGNPG